MARLNIRKVELDDAAAIVRIYNHYVRESVATFEVTEVSVGEMERRIEAISADGPYFVAQTADGDIVGYCYAHKWKERAAYSHTWETTVYVAPDQRGNGVGTALMQALVPCCAQMGAHVLVACITGGNHVSVRLHEQFGFRQVSHFEQVGVKFGRWLDVVDMQLTLGNADAPAPADEL